MTCKLLMKISDFLFKKLPRSVSCKLTMYGSSCFQSLKNVSFLIYLTSTKWRGKAFPCTSPIITFSRFNVASVSVLTLVTRVVAISSVFACFTTCSSMMILSFFKSIALYGMHLNMQYISSYNLRFV